MRALFDYQPSIQLTDDVSIQDLCVDDATDASDDSADGNSPLKAKNGSVCSVYYEGRLAASNEVFDSVLSGRFFTFKLGCGEVIRGWDIGVVGMKVGSNRRIVVKPAAAYGLIGRPPVIPRNATLIYDVQLIEIN